MKTKKIFAVLLAVMMLASMLFGSTLTSFALNTPNDIKSVALTLEAPKAGATANRSVGSVTCDAPMDYKVVAVHWYKDNATDYVNDRLGEGDNDKYFVGDHSYTVKIELSVKGDKTWNFEYVQGEPVYHITATVNGQSATVSAHDLNPSAKTICVTYKFENIPVGEFTPYVSIGTPVAGKTKNDVIVEPYNKRQMRLASWSEDCNWYYNKGGQWVAMEAEDTFAAGKDYRLVATFYANDGFRFSASGTHTVGDDGYIYGYVNGKQMSMKLDKYGDNFLYNSVKFTYDFESCEAQELDEVSFSGIAAPVAGQHPQYAVTMGDDTYALVTDATVNGGAQYGFVNGLAWASKSGTPLNAESVFEAGSTYQLSFFIQADDIHCFSDWMEGSANVGYVSVEPMFDDPTLAFVSVEFAPCGGGVMTDINVGGVTEPVNGAKPDYDFTYGQGYDKGDADPSIVWFDLTANKELTAEDTFEYGHTYELLIILRSDKAINGDAGEFEFAPVGTLKAKINGEDVGAIMARPTYPETHYVQLAKTFECAKAPITEVRVTVENPMEGKRPAQQIKLGSDTYVVESFMIADDETGTVLKPDEVYVGAKNYSITVFIEAKEGYAIPVGITAVFVNGQQANVIAYGVDSVIFTLILMADELPQYSVNFSDGQSFLTKAGVITLPEYEGVLQENEKFVGWTVDGQMTFVGEYYVGENTDFTAVVVAEDVHQHIYDNSYTDNGQGMHEKRCIDEECPDISGSVISGMHQYGNSGPCDVICEVCGHERTSESEGYAVHTYEFVCSAVCPSCGKQRETTHTPGAAATCTEAQKCTVCAKVLANALGHTAGEAATCAKAQTCTACGVELNPATGAHTPGEAATCAKAQKCTVCDAELAPVTSVHTPGEAATCAKAQKCTVCDAELAPITSEHTPGAAATCTEAQKCTVCGVEVAPAKGHTAGKEWLQDKDGHWHACAACSSEAERAAHADADGDGLCDVCAYEIGSASEGMPGWAIALIIIGAVLLLGGGGFCVWWFVIRKKAPEFVKEAEGAAPTEEKKDEE